MTQKLEKSTPIVVMSGPSGCGKSSLLKIVFSKIENYYFSISTTTRAPRAGETHGVEYFFVSKEEFEKDIAAGEFLEYASVHNNYYGTSLKPVKKALQEGKIVLFDIDVQGHDILRQKLDSLITSVFITTPNITELQKRLDNRKTDTQEVIAARIANAQHEIHSFYKYDFLIVNDDLQKAADALLNVIQVAFLRAKLYDKDALIANWLKN